MKKILKITIIFLIILNVYTSFFCVNADEKYNVGGTSQGIWEIGNQFLNLGAEGTDRFNSRGAKKSFEVIIDFLLGLGMLTVVISTVVLGIKYMLVSPNEKSKIKQATTPYLIGTIIIFGALTIWKLIINILEGSMLGG